MLSTPELLARAADCERLAGSAEFRAQRALLLELAAKWRRLAACSENGGEGPHRHVDAWRH